MTDPGDAIIGRIIDGRYEILARIGKGGTGVVYKARQKSIDRIVAIKMLNKELANDDSWVRRFYNEAKACSQLQHPNTIRMFDFGQSAEGNLYMTMEHLAGRSLRQVIQNAAPIAPIRVLKILVQCCGSLGEAHAIGIIHRDIKPDNVFLLDLAGSPDHVKVLDFSVAKLLQDTAGLRTQAGVVFGTPQYMSPEQGRGRQLDPRSDLYALGVLGYQMIAGKVPFDDPNPISVLQMHASAPLPPLPLSVPPELRAIIEKALAKDPAARFQTAAEMLDQCQAAFAHLAGHAPPPVLSGSPQAAQQYALPPGAKTAPPAMPPGAPPPGAPPPEAPPPGAPPAREPSAEDSGVRHGEKTVLATGGVGTPPPIEAPAPSQPVGNKTVLADAPSSQHGVPPDPAAEQKTMLAGDPRGHGPPAAAAPPAPAASDNKTVLAGAAPSGQEPPAAGAPPPATPGGGEVKKTMMLQDSSGVVSYAQGGAPGMAAPAQELEAGYAPAAERRGPSILFWILCLVAGMAVGVGAYWLVLGLGG